MDSSLLKLSRIIQTRLNQPVLLSDEQLCLLVGDAKMNLFSVYIQIISISHRSFIRKRRSLEELII